MSLRKDPKSTKSKPANQQPKNDISRSQSGDVDDASLMRDLLLEQAMNKTEENPKGESVKTDSDDPFETNATLRAIMGTLRAKASTFHGSKDDKPKSTSVIENQEEPTRQEAKPVPASRKRKRINRNQDHGGLRHVRVEDDEAALLTEMLMARHRVLTSKAQTSQRQNSKGRNRKGSDVELDPLSNEALRCVMRELLEAEKEGRIEVVGPPAPPDAHSIPATRTDRLVLGSFLEKSVLYHMPHPGLHIDGVPDEDDQEKPLSFPSPQKPRNEIRGFGTIIYNRTTSS
jgi:hypothetical protein